MMDANSHCGTLTYLCRSLLEQQVKLVLSILNVKLQKLSEYIFCYFLLPSENFSKQFQFFKPSISQAIQHEKVKWYLKIS